MVGFHKLNTSANIVSRRFRNTVCPRLLTGANPSYSLLTARLYDSMVYGSKCPTLMAFLGFAILLIRTLAVVADTDYQVPVFTTLKHQLSFTLGGL